MSGLKSAGIAVGVLAVAGAIAFGSGAIKLRGPEGDAPAGEGASPDASKKEPAATEAPEDLEGLGYISSVPIKKGEEERKGVVKRSDAVAGDGLFIVNPTWERNAGGPVREAVLMTMAGEEVHRWVPTKPDAGEKGWGGARLDDEGFLHVVADGALVKYDWAGNEVWRHQAEHHHDLAFDLDGSPVVVSAKTRNVKGVEGVKQEITIEDHGLVFFSRSGEVEEEVWLWDALKGEARMKEVMAETVEWKVKRFGERVDWTRPSDVFHLNSLQVLPRDVEGLGERGDLLISPRRWDRVLLLDREKKVVQWVWGEGELDHQHDPSVSDDGKVVVFDNGKRRKTSRVVVVDPVSGAIVRDYHGEDGKTFYSSGRGSVQSLDDGSLFVVIANEARIVQVGPTGDEVQWEYVSPWIVSGSRLPIRGVRLEGAVLEHAKKIVAGEVPKPAAG
jgi:hypothetical protein